MLREELSRYLDELLEVSKFKDYCPNGLQVEGRAEIRRIVTGVTASAALIERAVDEGADAIIVHHGFFWRGEDPRIVGPRRARVAALLGAAVNLFAYHLPLDAHPVLGNNAQLAATLGFEPEGRMGDEDLVLWGRLAAPGTLGELAGGIEARLGRTPLVIGDTSRPVARIAWCTGAAQGHFEAAIALGVDAYLTGEISEQHVHLARESGVAFIAAGHHATERGGVRALGDHLAGRFGLEHRFVEIPNPV